MYEESLALNRETGNQSEIGYSLVGLGRVLLREGKFAEARTLQEEARDIRERIGAKSALTESRLALAEILVHEGRFDSAVEAASAAARLARDQKQSDLEARCDAVRAMGLLELRQFMSARSAVTETENLRRNEMLRGTRIEVDIVTARVDAALGAVDGAVAKLEGVLAETKKLGLAAYELEARIALAEVRLRAKQTAQGEAELRQVEAGAKTRGFVLIQRTAAALRGSVR